MGFLRKVSESDMKQLFETRSHSWVDAGLARQLSRRALRRARIQIVLFAPLLAGVLFLYSQRKQITGADLPIQAGTRIALVMLGWALVPGHRRVLRPAPVPRL